MTQKPPVEIVDFFGTRSRPRDLLSMVLTVYLEQELEITMARKARPP